MIISCKCKCGKFLEKYDNRGRERRYLHGHSNTGEKHWNWRGEKVGYGGIHDWVVMHLGNPSECEACKSTVKKKYEWANKDHKYRRNLKDYMRLCTSCHRKFDIKNNNYKK